MQKGENGEGESEDKILKLRAAVDTNSKHLKK